MDDLNSHIYDLVAANETEIGQLEWSLNLLTFDPSTQLAMNRWPYLGIWSLSANIEMSNDLPD